MTAIEREIARQALLKAVFERSLCFKAADECMAKIKELNKQAKKEGISAKAAASVSA